MKYLTLVIILMMASIQFSTAQDKAKEVGIGLGLFDFPNDFSLVYKAQKKENKWFRLNAVVGFFRVQKLLDNPNAASPLSTSLGLSLGVEKRKAFNRVEILRGPQVILGTNINTFLGDSNVDPAVSVYGGLSYLFGAQVGLDNGMRIGVETSPGIIINYASDGNDGLLDINLGFDSNAIRLFFTYHFNTIK